MWTDFSLRASEASQRDMALQVRQRLIRQSTNPRNYIGFPLSLRTPPSLFLAITSSFSNRNLSYLSGLIVGSTKESAEDVEVIRKTTRIRWIHSHSIISKHRETTFRLSIFLLQFRSQVSNETMQRGHSVIRMVSLIQVSQENDRKRENLNIWLPQLQPHFPDFVTHTCNVEFSPISVQGSKNDETRHAYKMIRRNKNFMFARGNSAHL